MNKYIFVAIALLLGACERQSVPVAGVEDRPGSRPAYELEADRASTDTTDYVQAVVGGEETFDGEALYATNCATCHQINGQGLPGAFPPLDGSEWVTGSPETMAAIMVYGLQGPITVKGTEYNSAMAPLGATLNNQELAAIATYVRSAWSNSADAVGPELIERVRQKWGARSMLTVKELEAGK